MKKLFKYSQFLTLGVFLLSSSVVLSASTQCYSPAELNNFKTLYIKLQNELNYEGKDAYLNKNFQLRLKPHSKDAAYPGREFESALFGEYQNSLKKVAKLYQSAKFDNDDNFKSNDVLINFMKAIDDKTTESQDFINKTKIKDVISALEEASQKKFGKSSDKKFMINSGDKYLLEKLLIHAQDRVCSVNKYEDTNKDTALFKADYLKQIKNAPLNVLINTIKSAPIEKDSKIELKPASDLVASLVDPDVAIQSAVADNLNQLSAWVKKVKAQGPECFAAIKRKEFANNIQGNIQGCNFGHFIETLGQNNVNNLESVLHFINANEKLLNNPTAIAETGMNELKLEGFISKTFDNLGTAVRCTVLDPANSGDKKIFIRNLPFNDKSNKFDTSGIICKSNAKILGADACNKQFDLSSDGLGRGLEIKPKKGASSNLTFSVKDSDNCSDIPLQPGTNASLASTAEQCSALLKDGSAFVWDTKSNKCNEVEISKVSSIDQCVSLKKEGSVFNWDNDKKSCGEFSALLVDASLKQSAQQCIVQKKNGYTFKWDASKKSCDEIPTMAGTKLESKIACDAKISAGLPFHWNASENSCEAGLANTNFLLKNSGTLPDLSKVTSLEQCVALKKQGSVFNWNTDKNSCEEKSALLVSANQVQSSQQCLAQKKNGYDYKWDSANKSCREIPTTTGTIFQAKIACEAKVSAGLPFHWNAGENSCVAGLANTNLLLKNPGTLSDISKATSLEQCVALKKQGSVFNWNSDKNTCEEKSALLVNANQVQASQQCLAQKKNGYDYKWDSANKSCREIPTTSGTIFQAKIACEAKTSAGLPFKWNSSEFLCEKSSANTEELRSPAFAASADVDEKLAKMACEAKSSPANNVKWNPTTKNCEGSMSTSSKDAGKPTSVILKSDTKTPQVSDVSEKVAKMACESKSSPGNIVKWNSATKSCDGIARSTSSTSSTPVSPPTTSTTSHSNLMTDKIVADEKNSPYASSKEYKDVALSNLMNDRSLVGKAKCEEKKEEGFAFQWDKETSNCIKKEIAKAQSDCLAQNATTATTGIQYSWDAGKLKCDALDLNSKEKCEKQTAKEGFTFIWDSVKESCNEVEKTPSTNADKPADADKSGDANADLDKKQAECEQTNTKWVNEENDGVPATRYSWEENECKDLKKDSATKKPTGEVASEEEAPSAPKRAPARFVPINIPSRQIYLMPGMP